MSFELWPCGVAFTLTVRSAEGRSEPAAHPPANASYSAPKWHWSCVLNGHFWNFANFSVHKRDRRTTGVCSCRGNECACVYVKCHITQLIFACICFWGSHCIYSKNVAYITYSCGLVIDSDILHFLKTLFLSWTLSIHTVNNRFIWLWLFKRKLLQHTKAQTIVS